MPKPAHLTPENAARFRDRAVVDRYHLRLPYPAEVFDILVDLIADEPSAVLDAGCGPGDIARRLAARVARVDAVDISPAMIEKGHRLPGGDHPHLRWICGPVEEVALEPPYALISAADSLHWMEWEVALPRFARVCTPRGVLAIVHRDELPAPWQDGLAALIRRYSTMRNYQPFDLAVELEQRGLFQKIGAKETAPVTSTQPVEDYVASFHSRSSLSLEIMSAADAAAFDTRLRDLVSPWSTDGTVELQTVGVVVWGWPKR